MLFQALYNHLYLKRNSLIGEIINLIQFRSATENLPYRELSASPQEICNNISV